MFFSFWMNISFSSSHWNQGEVVLLGGKDGQKPEHHLPLQIELDLFLSLCRCLQGLMDHISVCHLCRLMELYRGESAKCRRQLQHYFFFPLAESDLPVKCFGVLWFVASQGLRSWRNSRGETTWKQASWHLSFPCLFNKLNVHLNIQCSSAAAPEGSISYLRNCTHTTQLFPVSESWASAPQHNEISYCGAFAKALTVPESITFWGFFANSKCSCLKKALLGGVGKQGISSTNCSSAVGLGVLCKACPSTGTHPQISMGAELWDKTNPAVRDQPLSLYTLLKIKLSEVCTEKSFYTTLWTEKVIKFKKQTTATCSYTDYKPGNCQSIFLVAGFPQFYFPQQQLDTMDMHWI